MLSILGSFTKYGTTASFMLTTTVPGRLSLSVPSDLRYQLLSDNLELKNTSENAVSELTGQHAKVSMAEKSALQNERAPAPNRLTTQDSVTVPIYEACSLPRSFSLTFDDGPSSYSSQLDRLLERHNTKGTYFINGNNVGCIFDYADILIERFKEGHLIASHTWSHVHLEQGTYAQIHDQLARLENALIFILGVRPLYFRPPFGEYNDLVIQVLAERGYKGMILWNQDSEDSLASPPTSAQIIEAYTTWPNKTLALNHEDQKFTVNEVMPVVLPYLTNGFDLMTVRNTQECIGISSDPRDWYEAVGEPGLRNASWTCEGTPDSGMYS